MIERVLSILAGARNGARRRPPLREPAAAASSETATGRSRQTFEDFEARKLLLGSEIDAEKTSAVVRLVVFAALAASLFSTEGSERMAASIEVALGIYGAGTVVGLALAWRRIFHPVVPYLFVSFDVVLVSTQILILTRLMGMGSGFALALPTGALIFVFLIHAAMRYRPWLIVYAAGLFLATLGLGGLFLAGEHPAGPNAHLMHHDGMESVMNYQILPVTLVALAAVILFVTSRRMRVLLLTSIVRTNRELKLARYFSPNLAERLAEADDDAALAGRRSKAAVLFVDIRSFTALGESMTPEQLTSFLSEYRTRLTRPIFLRDGMVDKFIGDAIMAVFGAPLQRPDDADRALACALDILDAAHDWSAERERLGQPPVAIGIGVHYGEVFAGVLGSEQLLEYTVIGDTVNVAERLERLSREVDSPLVVSATLLESASETRETVGWKRLPGQNLRGHSRPVDAFCLAGRRQACGPDIHPRAECVPPGI